MPPMALVNHGDERTLSNHGAMPTRMRKEGRKMAMVAMSAPRKPCTR